MNRRQFLAAAAAAPAAVRASLAAGPVALVTCDSEARLAVVDLRTLRVTGSIATLPDPRSVETVGDVAVVCRPRRAAGLGAPPDDLARRHHGVGGVRLRVRTRRRRPGFPAHDVGLAPDGRLWITSGAERVLAVGAARHDADLRRRTSLSATAACS